MRSPTTGRMSRVTCVGCRSWRPRITPVSPPERAKKNEGRNAVRIDRARATRMPAVSILAGMVLTVFAASAVAQVPEIRFARQFSMGYLQFNVMERNQLLEKHAKAAGIPEVKVVWATFNSPAAMNDALLSGSIDIVSGGVPGLLTIWARTHGTANAVKGMAAFSSQPFLLNTRNPNVKSITDFTDKDRIALPTVKISVQAMMLQMAAAKQWGQSNRPRPGSVTLGVGTPEAWFARLTDTTEITSVFSVPPFQ